VVPVEVLGASVTGQGSRSPEDEGSYTLIWKTGAMSQLKTGDPTDPATDFGPLSSEKAAQTFVELTGDAVSRGAALRTGGKRVEGPVPSPRQPSSPA
jgi:hypothetical protein